MKIENMTTEDIVLYLDERMLQVEETERLNSITKEETDLDLIRNSEDYEKVVFYDRVRIGDPVSHIIHKSFALNLKVVAVYVYYRHKKGNKTTGYAKQDIELHSMKYDKNVTLKMKVKDDVQINLKEGK